MSEKEVLYNGRFVNLVKTGRWEYAERSREVTGIVAIIAATDDGRVILVEQYRPPCQGRCIEFPAGLVGDKNDCPNESLEEAAIRELEEETGYKAASMTKVAEGPASAGITSEIISLYLAEGLEKVSAGGGDESENIQVHLVPLSEAYQWLQEKSAAGIHVDVKVYAGLYFLHGCHK
ncbi:NUDIX hydrolase [bacterium]|nr:NUDIX hydrolase [bacterium]